MGYGKAIEAYVVICKQGDHWYTSPKVMGDQAWFESFLPHAGWKKSRKGYWSCPACVEKRGKKKEADQAQAGEVAGNG
jgi:hypothetical protein